MFSGLVLVAVAALASAEVLPPATEAITVPLVPKAITPAGCAVIRMSLAPPEGKWKLPSLIGQRPLYGIYEFRGKKLLFILDCTGRWKAYYDRLWIDTNGNGDITDEKPFTTARQCTDIAPFSVKIPCDAKGEAPDVALNWCFYSFRAAEGFLNLKSVPNSVLDNSVIVNIRREYRASGSFNLNGKTYCIDVADGNANGFFNDRARSMVLPGSQVSRFAGDWFFMYENVSRREYCQFLGDLLYIDNMLFVMTVDQNGDWLRLNPYKDELVSVNLPCETEHLLLTTVDGRHSLAAYRPGTKLLVPPNEYRLVSYVFMRKNESGDTWLLTAEGTPSGPLVSVATEGSLFPLGEPFTVSLNAFIWPDDVSYNYQNLRFWVHGCGGEKVTKLYGIPADKIDVDLSIQAFPNGDKYNKPPLPTYKIISPAGETLAKGALEYG